MTSLSPLALALSAAALLAQAPDSKRAVPKLDAAAQRIDSRPGLHALDGRLWGGGEGYKVGFDAGGVEFIAAFGSAADRNHPLTFRLHSVGRGESTAPLAAASARLQGLRLEYDRGAVVERYDVHLEGIEQSFVFSTLPPGTGDLVVRGRLETELQVAANGDGLRFDLPGVGGFTMGGVTGIDAQGARARGTVRYADGWVEYALPASFVASAALPLTLDPVIGGVFGVTPTDFDDRDPEVAYEVTRNVYLVIWTRIVSASDWDVHGQLVSSAGALIGPRLFLAATTGLESQPRICSCPVRDAFVVTYTRNSAVLGRSVNAATAALSVELPIAVGASRTTPKHSSTLSSSLNDPSVVCAWQSEGDAALQATRVSVSSGLALSIGTVHTFGGRVRPTSPRLSQSDRGTGRHALVYQRENTNPVHSDVMIMVVDGTGAQVVPEHVLDASTLDDDRPTVDGDGTNWIVAWNRTGGIGAWCLRSISFDPTVPGMLVENGPIQVGGTIERTPTVIALRDSCLTGTIQNIVGVSVRAWDPFQCTGCEAGAVIESTGGVRGCSVLSGGGTGDDALLVFDRVSNNNGEIAAARFVGRDGLASSLGGGCGSGGTNRATCAISPNPAFSFRLRDSLPNAPAVLVVSSNRLNFPCGSCTLVPNPTTGIMLATSTDGSGDQEVRLTVPGGSPLLGVPFVTQWVALDLASPACPLFQIEMSNALQVTIEVR